MQTIGFLAHLRSIHSHGPYLVVGPLSTLSNWKAEFERWLPDMPCVLYHGSKAQREELRRSRMPTGACAPTFVCHPEQETTVLVTERWGLLAGCVVGL